MKRFSLISALVAVGLLSQPAFGEDCTDLRYDLDNFADQLSAVWNTPEEACIFYWRYRNKILLASIKSCALSSDKANFDQVFAKLKSCKARGLDFQWAKKNQYND